MDIYLENSYLIHLLSEQDGSKDLKHTCSGESALKTCAHGRYPANIQSVNTCTPIYKITIHNIHCVVHVSNKALIL